MNDNCDEEDSDELVDGQKESCESDEAANSREEEELEEGLQLTGLRLVMKC